MMVDLLDNQELQQVGVVAIAGGLGAVIGIEREFADKPAGLRTHVLVCAASATLMMLGQILVDGYQASQLTDVATDPIRTIQAIVVGMGQYVFASGVAVLALLVLLIIGWLERGLSSTIEPKNQSDSKDSS